MKHMNQKAAICEYLRQNHVGVEKAVCSRELERLFSLDGRSLRKKINSLRQDGYPICSGVTGYFYVANQQEINGTVCRLNELILKISNARTGLLYSSVQPCNEVTLEVNIHLTEGR